MNDWVIDIAIVTRQTAFPVIYIAIVIAVRVTYCQHRFVVVAWCACLNIRLWMQNQQILFRFKQEATAFTMAYFYAK